MDYFWICRYVFNFESFVVLIINYHPTCFYLTKTILKDAKKIQVIYEKSKEFIHKSLFTDTMFLYQPSQIALATVRIAAKEFGKQPKEKPSLEKRLYVSAVG